MNPGVQIRTVNCVNQAGAKWHSIVEPGVGCVARLFSTVAFRPMRLSRSHRPAFLWIVPVDCRQLEAMISHRWSYKPNVRLSYMAV
jgi:hypothetical protein